MVSVKILSKVNVRIDLFAEVSRASYFGRFKSLGLMSAYAQKRTLATPIVEVVCGNLAVFLGKVYWEHEALFLLGDCFIFNGRDKSPTAYELKLELSMKQTV